MPGRTSGSKSSARGPETPHRRTRVGAPRTNRTRAFGCPKQVLDSMSSQVQHEAGGSMRRVSTAIGVAVFSLALLFAGHPNVADAQTGTYSGTIQANYSAYGASATSAGQWSFTVSANDRLTGGMSVAVTANLPPVSGCTYSPSSKITLSVAENWAGFVRGTVAVIEASGSDHWSPASVNFVCKGQTTAEALPVVPLPSQRIEMNLAKLENGGQYTPSAGGLSETYTLTKSPSSSSSSPGSPQPTDGKSSLGPATTVPSSAALPRPVTWCTNRNTCS